jgi:hypothetical protein
MTHHILAGQVAECDIINLLQHIHRNLQAAF